VQLTVLQQRSVHPVDQTSAADGEDSGDVDEVVHDRTNSVRHRATNDLPKDPAENHLQQQLEIPRQQSPG